jgi:hypothetical protein
MDQTLKVHARTDGRRTDGRRPFLCPPPRYAAGDNRPFSHCSVAERVFRFLSKLDSRTRRLVLNRIVNSEFYGFNSVNLAQFLKCLSIWTKICFGENR